MKKNLKASLQFMMVTLGIIFLTSFSIDATDTLRGSQTALGIFAQNVTEDSCPEFMVRVENGEGSFCIDIYEVSPNDDCIIKNPQSTTDTANNISQRNCQPQSVPQALPWTSVARPQAAELCAKVGKRLPTAKEWYESALGTTDGPLCNLDGSLQKTGSYEECVSGSGAFDMIGNVWEHTSETISDGMYQGRNLPTEGYVALIDDSGVALETLPEPSVLYHEDYFWAKEQGYFTLIRGGFYGSKADGGLYAVHAQTDQNFASAAIGFRCVK